MPTSFRRISRWARLASMLLVLSYGLRASTSDSPPGPAPQGDRGHHIMAWGLDLTPAYMGQGRGPHTQEVEGPHHTRLLVGLDFDYLYRFGFFRMGAGVRLAHVLDRLGAAASGPTLFGVEISVPLLLSAAYTFQGGQEIALTAGFGYAGAFLPGLAEQGELIFDHGWHTEVLASVAIPISKGFELSIRSGGAYGVMHGPRSTQGFLRMYVPIGVGVRKPW